MSVEPFECLRTLEDLRSLPDPVRLPIFPDGLKRTGRPAMGFERRTYSLDFGNTNWEGLEVRARGINLDEAMELQRLMDLGRAMLEPGEEREADRRAFYGIMEKMLISWNRTDDGEPVPLDEKHLREEEWTMLQQMTLAYLRAVLSVPPPLSQPSSDGAPSGELFRLMEQQSESPPN